MKRGSTGDQLVQYHPQAVNVGSYIDIRQSSLDLFRRHIGGRSQHGPSPRRVAPNLLNLCESKVSKLRDWNGLAYLSVSLSPCLLVIIVPDTRHLTPDTYLKQHITRFDITVQDTVRVCMLDGISELRD
jgi:hypothetical protein